MSTKTILFEFEGDVGTGAVLFDIPFAYPVRVISLSAWVISSHGDVSLKFSFGDREEILPIKENCANACMDIDCLTKEISAEVIGAGSAESLRLAIKYSREEQNAEKTDSSDALPE